jgi:hypothetical protein
MRKEMEILRRSFAHVKKDPRDYSKLMRDGRHLSPIPFFGAPSTARVLTLGLNPSSTAFQHAPKFSEPQSTKLSDYCHWLVNYFEHEKPAHEWFSPWIEVLAGLELQYGHDAAHIDLSPRLTLSAGNFRSTEVRNLFLEMVGSDIAVLNDALDRARNVRCILAAGTATNRYYINEFIQAYGKSAGLSLEPVWRREHGAGQFATQELVRPGQRPIPFFFCTSGPSHRPKGKSRRRGEILIRRMHENREAILAALARD